MPPLSRPGPYRLLKFRGNITKCVVSRLDFLGSSATWRRDGERALGAVAPTKEDSLSSRSISFGRALVVSMHSEVSVFQHANPERVVLHEAKGKGFLHALFGGPTDDPLRTQKLLRRLSAQLERELKPFNGRVSDYRCPRLGQDFAEPLQCLLERAERIRSFHYASRSVFRSAFSRNRPPTLQRSTTSILRNVGRPSISSRIRVRTRSSSGPGPRIPTSISEVGNDCWVAQEPNRRM